MKNPTWGKHLDAMTERMLHIFPRSDGFFLDELHWNQFDFAHDDGVSARRDKPVAMIGFAVQDATRRICEIAHRQGKAVWANAPNTLEVAHCVDGFMAECSWEWLGTILYLGLEKPVVLLMPGGWDVSQLKEALNAALFAGAQPSVVNAPKDRTEYLKLLQGYQPLFKMLRGRKWILDPHAVTSEASALRTNCFRLTDGDVAITVSRFPKSDHGLRTADGYVFGKDQRASITEGPARIRLGMAGVDQVRSAQLFSADGSTAPLDLELGRTNDGITVSFPEIEAGIIRLGFSK